MAETRDCGGGVHGDAQAYHLGAGALRDAMLCPWRERMDDVAHDAAHTHLGALRYGLPHGHCHPAGQSSRSERGGIDADAHLSDGVGWRGKQWIHHPLPCHTCSHCHVCGAHPHVSLRLFHLGFCTDMCGKNGCRRCLFRWWCAMAQNRAGGFAKGAWHSHHREASDRSERRALRHPWMGG